MFIGGERRHRGENEGQIQAQFGAWDKKHNDGIEAVRGRMHRNVLELMKWDSLLARTNVNN